MPPARNIRATKKTPVETTGKKRTYISLFSSAGVGCYGFDKHSYECVATNELLEERLDVQRANKKCRYKNGYICGDIRLDSTRDKLFKAIEFWRRKGFSGIDVVFATPPCQGMSTVNYKKAEDEQVRNSLVVEAIDLIGQIKPKVFVFENVRAFMHTVCTDISGEDMSIGDSIQRNLGNEYHIYSKVINFKDYGVPSSRPRTIVIGTLRSLRNIAPLNLFPSRRNETTLRQAIGRMARLGFGEKDSRDFLHFARPYPEYMEEWIANLAEGESAFTQEDTARRPYKIDSEGNRIELKGAYMGNKYRRLYWNRPGACIATRNDQLASQDTIHPSDNRVLSIRELMRLMTIPDSFRWSEEDRKTSPLDSEDYLKKHELNIRRCIGEAVPTEIIRRISGNISTMLDFEDFVENHKSEELAAAVESPNFYIRTFAREQLLSDAKSSGSFYTPQSVVFDAIKNVRIEHNEIHILEPAVGLGAFLPQLCSMFSNAERVVIDAVEISPEILGQLQDDLRTIELGTNVHINFICADFLEWQPGKVYNLVVSNPPYGKSAHRHDTTVHKTQNLFALFMIKFRQYADNIVCVIPKTFAIAAEYMSVRRLYEDMPVAGICDFGVKFFKKVFVEILSVHFEAARTEPFIIHNYLTGEKIVQPQGYIYHDRLWLLYRNEWFDNYIATLELDVFDFFRDRQITNSHISNHGRIWVVKSKNILDDGTVAHIDGYDRYINDITPFSVSRFYGTGALIFPNFTYNTRAALLPDGSIPNGSVAILLPRHPGIRPQPELYATPDFRRYYAIVKSYSRFTINIDSSSIYYIGIPR